MLLARSGGSRQWCKALQAARVRDVIKGMELDVWGLQEVVGASAFTQLLGTLPGYAGFLANDPLVEGGAASYSDFGNQEQKVAFVYRTSVVQVTGARIILAAWDYAFAGRPPLEVRIRATVGGATVDGVVVVLHAKAGADVESRDRRASGAEVLEGYLDATWPDTPVWVIGDFNDDVDTSILAGQPSPYANFVTSAAWSFPTGALSASGVTSTLGYADMIDHHLISDEVLDRYQAGSAEAYRVDGYIPKYGESTSDHLPVLTRYTLAGAAR